MTNTTPDFPYLTNGKGLGLKRQEKLFVFRKGDPVAGCLFSFTPPAQTLNIVSIAPLPIYVALPPETPAPVTGVNLLIGA